MRGGGGQKMSVFVHAQGIKTVHAGGCQKWQNSVHVVIECPLKAVVGNQNFFSFGFPCSFKEGLKVSQKKFLMKTEVTLFFLVELFNSFIFRLKIRKIMGDYCFDT